MPDLIDIQHLLEETADDDVLATLVAIDGSSYRRPGARLLIRADGSTAGGVSGGCLESDLVELAGAVRKSGAGRLVRYDTRQENDLLWGTGLGCQGVVTLVLEPLPFHAGRLLREAIGFWRDGFPVAIGLSLNESRPATIGFARPGADPAWLQPDHSDRSRIESAFHASKPAVGVSPVSDIWIDRPPVLPRLWVFGAGADAVPLAETAARLGWRVEITDHRPGMARAERFPFARTVHAGSPVEFLQSRVPDSLTAAVVMHHHFERDRTTLEALSANPPAYLGILGPKVRTGRLFEALSESAAVRLRDHPGIHAPVGLDIGAEGPEAVALSILGEIQAQFAGRKAGSLRDRQGPIHDPAERGHG